TLLMTSRNLIKTKQSLDFDNIVGSNLTLWHVNHPAIVANKHQPVLLNIIDSSTELDPTGYIADIFAETPPKKTIHILVQCPPPKFIHRFLSRSVLAAPPLVDDSRPGTPLSSDLHTDIKKITDKFFAPGPIVDFIDVFVKGEGTLPMTSGSIRGLPRAWRRGFGQAPEI
ncbi:hypothetical protein BGZ95_001582, partial [Linnemannia exigua]